MPIVTKLGKMVTDSEKLLPIKSHDPLIICSYKITWQTKTIISQRLECLWSPNMVGWWLTLRAPNCKVNWPLNPLNCSITWQILNHYISTNAGPMKIIFSRGLARSWENLKLKHSYPLSHMILRSFGITRSCDKLKPFYLHYRNAYGHQIW